MPLSPTQLALLDSVAPALLGRVIVLTGAGISVASGLPTFRGSGGLYEGLNPYQLATAEAFQERPVTVWNWYLMRIHQGKGAKPNAAHTAIKELEDVAEHLTLITSNVDHLHQMAGSEVVHRMHGDILQTKCWECGALGNIDPERLPESYEEESLPRCACGGMLRPNVVWFGERPWMSGFEAFQDELPRAKAFLEVGVSGVVNYGFTQVAARRNKLVLRINPEPDEEPGVVSIAAPSEEVLPELVARAKALRTS